MKRGHSWGRLDGQTPLDQRQRHISEFNNPDSAVFCFLLSTRTGGLGIDLTAADTLIMYDHDDNPHEDLQALYRAQRTDPKSHLYTYHLVTTDSVEESILRAAKEQPQLGHVAEDPIASMGRGEIQSILRMGVRRLFAEESPRRIKYDEVVLELLTGRQNSLEPAQASQAGAPGLGSSTEGVTIFQAEGLGPAVSGENEEATKEGDDAFWEHFAAQEDSALQKEPGKGLGTRSKVSVFVYGLPPCFFPM